MMQESKVQSYTKQLEVLFSNTYDDQENLA